MRTLAISSFALLLLVAQAGPAKAQGADQKAAAEVLFNEGRTLMDEGKFAQACSRLEQSQEIDPAVGTLGWLAQCYEKSGQTASAWATYRAAASFAQQRGQSDRQRIALDHAAQLEPTLSRLTIDASLVNGVDGVEVFRNGKPLMRALWSSPMPVDPGVQSLEIRAPGYAPVTLTVAVSAGGRATAKLPELARTVSNAAPAPTPAASVEPAAPSSAPVVGPSLAVPARDEAPVASGGHRSTPPQAIAGYFTGGVGVVGLGLGLAFYFQKNSKISARDAACPEVESGGVCPSEAKRQEYGARQDEAGSAATVSLVSTLAGAALLTTGIVLLVTAPPREQAARRTKVAPVALRGGAGLWMETTW